MHIIPTELLTIHNLLLLLRFKLHVANRAILPDHVFPMRQVCLRHGFDVRLDVDFDVRSHRGVVEDDVQFRVCEGGLIEKARCARDFEDLDHGVENVLAGRTAEGEVAACAGGNVADFDGVCWGWISSVLSLRSWKGGES
jgi:hypothetical protein